MSCQRCICCICQSAGLPWQPAHPYLSLPVTPLPRAPSPPDPGKKDHKPPLCTRHKTVCWSLLESFLSAFCFLLCLFISTSHNRKHTPHIHSKCLLALFQLGRNESEESRKDTGSGVLKERDYNAESVNNPAPKLAFLLCKPVSVCVCL